MQQDDHNHTTCKIVSMISTLGETPIENLSFESFVVVLLDLTFPTLGVTQCYEENI